jgi:hypothetical protein
MVRGARNVGTADNTMQTCAHWYRQLHSHPSSTHLCLQIFFPHPGANIFWKVLVHGYQVHTSTLRAKKIRNGVEDPVQHLSSVFPSCPTGFNAIRPDFRSRCGDVRRIKHEQIDRVEEARKEGGEEVGLEDFMVQNLKRGGKRSQTRK